MCRTVVSLYTRKLYTVVNHDVTAWTSENSGVFFQESDQKRQNAVTSLD